jgi:type IV pilus assembly protein PilB
MELEPFLLASSLIMVCAQRLCRRICLHCKTPVKIKDAILKDIDFPAEKIIFYQGKGCEHCNNSGFYGRVAILEVLMIDDSIRQMIIERRPCDEIKEYAIDKCNMETLRDDAFLKVKQGVISLQEALRVTTEE